MDKTLSSVSSAYKKELEDELKGKRSDEDEGSTRSFDEFRDQYLPKHLSYYEKAATLAGKIIPITPDKKLRVEIENDIKICHLNTTATGVYSLSFAVPIVLVLASLLFFFVFPVALGGEPNLFFVIFGLVVGLVVMIPLQKMPSMLSNSWRMKASNQMVLATFYIVTFMRHTSNLELALNFAADHLSPPLNLDLRKVVWNVETEKFESVKNSLDDYLETWKDWNMEFIESIHLIESSLLETSQSRRLDSLDKSLTVMLDETYEKMLHYAHGLKGPLTTLNMLGITLPILTLVLLPLVVSFLGGFRWYHLLAMYNIALPAIVLYIGKSILTKRPGGSGETDAEQKSVGIKKYSNVVVKMGKKDIIFSPIYFSIVIFCVLFFIGLLPIILYASGFPDYGLYTGPTGLTFGDISFVEHTQIKHAFFDYRERLIDGVGTGELVGPFGIGSLVLSIFLPLSIGLSMGLYYKLKTRNVIKVRDQAKALELEFSSALFQLGSRIGDGLPAESAFGRVAQAMQGTISGKFFSLVNANIISLGMNVEKAIFDPNKGALKYYPSDLIESSMKVLVESSRKGPYIASQALMNVSEYIKQMHRVNERLNDLMGDVISSMKSQVRFLSPVISAIVIGITSMITSILGNLGTRLGMLSDQSGNVGGASALLGMFGTGIPTYQFQAVVGIYVVQLAYILTIIGNGIENGPDKVREQYNLGKAMISSTLLYCGLATIIMILFNILASNLANVGGM